MKPQYGILRFAKYKGPEISKIEAHNERTKEQYASNPDIDMTKTHRNFHLVTPERKYRAEAEKQIAEAGLTPDHYFAALKLIEQLYKDGAIPAYMFRNILKEYADVVDLSQFVMAEEQQKEAIA